MALVVWFTVGLALWHFTVFVPDRFWAGIVGALLGAVTGAMVSGAIVQIVSGRTIVIASRTVGASRYSNMKIKRSNDLRAGRLGVRRRSTFNWCRSAITSPSSELLDRKRSRRIHLSRLRSSSTRRSSRDSGAQAKRMEFAVGTGVFQVVRVELFDLATEPDPAQPCYSV